MLLIKNAKILRTMAGSEILNGYVFIANGKIVETGEGSPQLELPPAARIIDAQGLEVLPGFVDAHCHVGMWEDAVGFEGDDGNESTDPLTPQLRAVDAIYHADRAFREAYEAGVTTVVTGPGSANVLGGQFLAMKTAGRRVDEMIVKEPVALKAAFGENPKHVYNERKQAPTTRMATAAIFREGMHKAREYLALQEKHSSKPDDHDKPEYDMKLEAMVLALKGDLPVKAHAHRADDIITAIRLAREFQLRMTLDHCTEGYMITDILYEEGFPVITGPLLTDRSKIELRNQTLKNPGILAKAGIKVAISTDAPCVPIQYLALSAAMAVREGMDEMDALRAITINAASIVGIDDRVGSIEPGKDADLVLMDGHPFDLKSRVRYTIINGKIVYEREQA
jgi:imidazolonepropionase-like amidohydrolase